MGLPAGKSVCHFTPKALKGVLLIAKPLFKAFPLSGSAKNIHILFTEDGTFSLPQTPSLHSNCERYKGIKAAALVAFGESSIPGNLNAKHLMSPFITQDTKAPQTTPLKFFPF